MNEIIVAKLIGLALDAIAAGVERDALITKVSEMEKTGAKPEEISAAIVQMRNDAIKAAQDAIDRAPE